MKSRERISFIYKEEEGVGEENGRASAIWPSSVQSMGWHGPTKPTGKFEFKCEKFELGLNGYWVRF